MRRNKKISILRIVVIFALIIAILGQFIFHVATHYEKFFKRQDSNYYSQLKYSYYQSQYAKKNSTIIITDEVFEEFASYAFLNGMNPIHIVHDHPPLGRYILSLSIVIFGNPKAITLFLLFASMLGLFLLARSALKDFALSLIPVAIFVNEPLFLGKLIYAPLPEATQSPFILFAFYFFIKAQGSKDNLFWYSVVSFFLGFVISIRFFVTGGAILFSMILFLTLIKKDIKQVLLFLFTTPLSLVILLFSYTRTILDGYSILQIFGVQKYILEYHKSAFIHPFSFWDLILFNKWHTWWGDHKILSDPHWILVWPISVIVPLVQVVLAVFKKLKLTDAEIVIYLWVGIYCLMLSTGYTSTRYFFNLLPFLYILMVSGLYRLYKYV